MRVRPSHLIAALLGSLGIVACSKATLGQPCVADSDCAGGLCLSLDTPPPPLRVCSHSCQADSDCLAGWTCSGTPLSSTAFCTCNPEPEVCDGLDNDCNGIIDDEPVSANGCVLSGGTGCVNGACTCPTGDTSCAGSCADIATDPSNCGACGESCAPGDTCTNGACDCPAGFELCDGGCANTGADPDNCGACGSACIGDQVCNTGVCGCAQSGLTNCAGQCVSTASDSENCGACGTVCPTGASCAASECQCGQSLSIEDDSQNCGACGHVCPPGTGCQSGVCGCPSDPADYLDDPLNCGACGNVCSSIGTCVGGLCRCPVGLVVCGTACVDITDFPTDRVNCGTCGNTCPNNATCTNGQCVCLDSPNCGTGCPDYSTDALNCGSCGNVCPSESGCVQGECLCTDGFALCGSDCLDPATYQTDPMNCGGCAQACQAPAPAVVSSCVSGACVELQTLAPPDSAACQLKLGADATNLYWSTSSSLAEIISLPTTGGTATTLATAPGPICDFALDDVNVYFVDGSGRVLQVSLATSATDVLASEQAGSTSIATDWVSVYWAAGGVLSSVPIGGGTVTTLVSGSSFDSLGFGPGGLFWRNGDAVMLLPPGAGASGIQSVSFAPGAVTDLWQDHYGVYASVTAPSDAGSSGEVEFFQSGLPFWRADFDTIATGQDASNLVTGDGAGNVFWLGLSSLWTWQYLLRDEQVQNVAAAKPWTRPAADGTSLYYWDANGLEKRTPE